MANSRIIRKETGDKRSALTLKYHDKCWHESLHLSVIRDSIRDWAMLSSRGHGGVSTRKVYGIESTVWVLKTRRVASLRKYSWVRLLMSPSRGETLQTEFYKCTHSSGRHRFRSPPCPEASRTYTNKYNHSPNCPEASRTHTNKYDHSPNCPEASRTHTNKYDHSSYNRTAARSSTPEPGRWDLWTKTDSTSLQYKYPRPCPRPTIHREVSVTSPIPAVCHVAIFSRTNVSNFTKDDR